MISSLKFSSRLSRLLCIGAVSGGLATAANATVVSLNYNFNALGELADFDFLNQNSSTVGFDATGGIGGGGSAVFQSTGASGLDKRALAIYSPGTTNTDGTTLGTPTFAFDATTTTFLRASILVHGSAIGDTPLDGKRKAHMRFGFLGDLNIPDPTKPQDIWKQNPSFVMDAKIEFENTAGKFAKLSIEPKASPGSNAEVKATKVEIENNGEGTEFNIDNWFRFELVVTRYTGEGAGPQSFTFGGSLFDLGPDGTDEPLSLGVSTFFDAFNAVPFVNLVPFGTDSTVYLAVQFETEKQAAPNEYGFQVDNIAFETVPEPSSALLGLASLAFLGRRRRAAKLS